MYYDLDAPELIARDLLEFTEAEELTGIHTMALGLTETTYAADVSHDLAVSFYNWDGLFLTMPITAFLQITDAVMCF